MEEKTRMETQELEEIEYMTKAEYASDTAGVVKQAKEANHANTAQGCNDAFALGGNPATYYAPKTDVDALKKSTDTSFGLVNTALNVISENAKKADEKAAAAQSTADGAKAGLANKVDKEDGKGLSSNDYTNAEKAKLANCVMSVNKIAPDTVGNINVVERIENPNGTAIKFADGTMICTKKTLINTTMLPTFNIFYKKLTNLGDWAVPFTEVPNILSCSATSIVMSWCGGITVNQSKIAQFNLCTQSEEKNLDFRIEVSAIGRWK